MTVDLSGYEPEGVSIFEETATIHIEISANSTMSFSFYSLTMEHTNTALYNYMLRNRPYVTVSGTEVAIAGLTAENFNPKINLSGLEAGTYHVPISITTPAGVTITASNLTAEIQITYIETAPPETTTVPPETESQDETTAPEDESTVPGDETTETEPGESETPADESPSPEEPTTEPEGEEETNPSP